jgi:hypothetical protein
VLRFNAVKHCRIRGSYQAMRAGRSRMMRSDSRVANVSGAASAAIGSSGWSENVTIMGS